MEKYKNSYLFSKDGIISLGGGDSKKGNTGIGVNTFLWQASLDTVSFMPLSSADPFGGVIITDWFTNPDVPNERFKMTIQIKDRQLTANGVSVSVFRQERRQGGWVNTGVNKTTNVKIEDAILTRARQIKIGQS